MNYAVVDLETTGLNPRQDRITEIGCLLVQDGVIGEPQSIIVNPHRELTSKIIEITHITQEMVNDGHQIDFALDWLNRRIKDCDLIVGHNFLTFDFEFLQSRSIAVGADTHRILTEDKVRDTAAWFKAAKLNELKRESESHAEFFRRILSRRVYGLKFNLLLACQELGVEYGDVSQHRAIGDIVLTQRIFEVMQDHFK